MTALFLYKWIVMALTMAFFMGAYALEQSGIPYVRTGGSSIFKVHIYSYIIFFVFISFLFRNGYNSLRLSMGNFSKFWELSFVLLVVVILHGLAKYGTSGMAYLVDDFLTPLLLLPILFKLELKQIEKLITLLAYFLLVNCLVALFEFALQAHVIAAEINFSYFRSHAFLNHPLNNSLITVSLAFLLMDKTKLPAPLYFGTVVFALFAFGGRTAMGLFVIAMFLLSLSSIWQFFSKGILMSKLRFAFYVGLTYLSVFAAVGIVFETDITGRIIEKLYVDRSVSARFSIIYLLEQLTPIEWIFGAGESLKDSVELYLDMNIIENYLVGWVFTFGLIGTIPLFISCYLPLLFFANKGEWVTKISVCTFFVVALSNNSLTTKTPVLLFLYLVLGCIYIRKCRIDMV